MPPKKVPKEERLVEEMKKVARNEGNKNCADCCDKMPTNVNLTLKTFVCTTCAGIHRSFNYKVKSLSASHFTEDEVSEMSKGGNIVSNNVYMARYVQGRGPPLPAPGSNDERMKTFIRQKYENRRYSAGGSCASTSSSSDSFSVFGSSSSVSNSGHESGIKVKVLCLEEAVLVRNYGGDYLRQLSLGATSHLVTLLPNGLGVWREDAGTGALFLVHCIDIQAMRGRLGDEGTLYIRDFAVASKHCSSLYDAMLAVAIETKVYIVILHEGRWDLLNVATTDKIINKVAWSGCATPTLLAYPSRGSPVLIQLKKRCAKIEQLQLFDSSLTSRFGSVGCIPTAVDAALFCSNSGTVSLDDNNTDPAMLFLNGLNALTTHSTPLTCRSDNLAFSNSLNSLNTTFTNTGQIRGVCADMLSACVCLTVEVNPQSDTSLVSKEEFVLKLPNQLDQPRIIADVSELPGVKRGMIAVEKADVSAVSTTIVSKTGSFRHALSSSSLMETLCPDVDAAVAPILRLNIADKKEAVASISQDSQLLFYHLSTCDDSSLYTMKYMRRIALRSLPARPDIIAMKELHGRTEGLIAVASSIDSFVNVLTINYASYHVEHYLYFDLLDYADTDCGKQSRIVCKGLQFSDDCTKIYAYGSWRASAKSTLASVGTGTSSSGAIYALNISKNTITAAVATATASTIIPPIPNPVVAITDDLLQLVLGKIEAMDTRLNDRLLRIERRLDDIQRDVTRIEQTVKSN